MPLAKTNHQSQLDHLSWMPLAEANHQIQPSYSSRMPLTKVDHQTQHSFAVDAEIISVHGSQLTKKSLMKIESLPT